MENAISYDVGCLIYPGTYVPLMKEEEVISALNTSPKNELVLPPVNITELSDSYKIELATPGVKREDFLIHADENTLSIVAVHKQSANYSNEQFQLHEFNYTCFDRHILLPENADTEFTGAEYKEGILRFYVPKTDQPAKNLHTRIAVY